MPAIAAGTAELIVVCSIFEVLAIGVVGCRVWAKRIKRKKLNWSDYLIFAALVGPCRCRIPDRTDIRTVYLHHHLRWRSHWRCWLSPVRSNFRSFRQRSTGTSREGWSLYQSNRGCTIDTFQVVFAAELLWLTSNTLIKLSTLVFYADLFRVSRFRRLAFGVMALTVLAYIGFVVKDFLICQPISRNWTFGDQSNISPESQSSGTGFCGITQAGTLATGITITILDFIIVVMPIPMLWRLKMPVAKKVFISCIFSIGLVVCICSGLRLWSVLALRYADLTFTIIPMGIFTLLEPLIGIIAASLPTVQPVLTKVTKSSMFVWTSSKISNSRSRSRSRGGRGRSLSGSRGLSVSKRSGSTTLGSSNVSSNNTKNFNRLYDHLYPTTMKTTPAADDADEINDDLAEQERQRAKNGDSYDLEAWPRAGIMITKGVHVESMRIEHADRPRESFGESSAQLRGEEPAAERKGSIVQRMGSLRGMGRRPSDVNKPLPDVPERARRPSEPQPDVPERTRRPSDFVIDSGVHYA